MLIVTHEIETLAREVSSEVVFLQSGDSERKRNTESQCFGAPKSERWQGVFFNPVCFEVKKYDIY